MDSCVGNNHTSDNITEQILIDKAKAVYYDTFLPTAVMLILFSMVGIPGNTIVILVYYKEKRLSTTKLIIFIIAVVDLISGLIVIPCNTINALFWLNITNALFCKFRWSLNVAVTVPVVYLIAGVTVVRYCHVCKPSKVHLMESMVKPFCAFCLLAGVIISSLTANCFGCRQWGSQDQYLPGVNCDPSHDCRLGLGFKIISHFWLIGYIVCLTSIVTMNSLILKRMFKQKKIMDSYKITKSKKRRKNRLAKFSGDNLDYVRNTVRRMSRLLIQSYNDDSIEDHTSHDSNFENQINISSTSTYISKTKTIESAVDKENTSEIFRFIVLEKEELPVSNEAQSYKSDKESSYSKSSSYNSKIDGVRHKRRQFENSLNVKKKTVSIEIENRGMNIETENKSNTTKFFSGSEHEKSYYKKLISLVKMESWNRTTLKLFVVSVVYVFSYMPFFTILLFINNVATLSLSTNQNEFKYKILPGLYLIFLGSAVNPLIYTFVDPKFRSQCKALFRKSRYK